MKLLVKFLMMLALGLQIIGLLVLTGQATIVQVTGSTVAAIITAHSITPVMFGVIADSLSFLFLMLGFFAFVGHSIYELADIKKHFTEIIKPEIPMLKSAALSSPHNATYLRVLDGLEKWMVGKPKTPVKQAVRTVKQRVLLGFRIILVLAGIISIIGYFYADSSTLIVLPVGGSSLLVGALAEKIGRAVVQIFSVVRNISFLSH